MFKKIRIELIAYYAIFYLSIFILVYLSSDIKHVLYAAKIVFLLHITVLIYGAFRIKKYNKQINEMIEQKLNDQDTK